MAKKHFDNYYNNYKQYFIATVEMAEELRKEALAGNITEDRVRNFQADAEPVIRTFRVLQEVARLINRPQREDKQKQAVFEKQTKRIIPKDDSCDLDKMVEAGEKMITELKDLTE